MNKQSGAGGTGLVCVGVGVSLLLVACGRPDGLTYHKLQGNRAEVEIRRDPKNQPSITVRRAESPADADWAVIEAQGFAEGEDRFLQMDMLRRATGGRLAELFGAVALPRDRETVGVGLRHAGERMLERVRRDYPEAFGLLEAFAAGVNRARRGFAETRPELLRYYREVTGDPAYVPEPWAPLDSLYIVLGASFRLSSTWKEKLALGAIAARFYQPSRRPQFNRLFDWRPIQPEFVAKRAPDAERETPRRNGANLRSGAAASFLPVDVGCRESGFPFGPCARDSAFGSNNWVATPSFTGGDGFLANDPHLPLLFPMLFYEVALDSRSAGGTFRVRGMNVPGTPGVLVGHNDRISWGFTNFPADVDDIYIERLVRGGTHVRFRGGEVAIREVPLVLRYRVGNQLRDDATVTKLRFVPHHGPIASDWYMPDKVFAQGMVGLRWVVGEPVALSYRWTGHEAGGEVAAILNLNRARDFGEFKGALSTFGVGAQNMVYLDVQGHIGYYVPGQFPLRPYASADWPPYLPQDGGGDAEWAGFRTRRPELYDPESGRIVTANNDPWGDTERPNFDGFRDYFGFDFSTGSRARRIVQLLDGKRGQLNEGEMQRIQNDHVDTSVRTITGLLKSSEEFLSAGAGATPVVRGLMERLANFDGHMSRREHTPVIADTWLREIGRQYWLEHERRGYKLPEGLTGLNILAKTLYHRLREGLAEQTPASRALVHASLAETQRLLEARGQGSASWGQVHRIEFYNPFEGLTRSMGSLPLERDGYFDSIDVSGPGLGPSFRLLITAKNGKFESVVSMPGGNYSPLDERNWIVELTAWRDGRYRPLVSWFP